MQRRAKLVISTTNMRSQGIKRLAEGLSQSLGYKVWRVLPGRERGRKSFLIRTGTSKDAQYRAFADNGVNCPEFTRDRSVAAGWIDSGSVVFCRTLLRASEGRGIVEATVPEELVDAPMYTKYMKKKQEFRVHVVNGEVIDVQEKRKRRGFENERNTKVRNVANGYVFCRDNVVCPNGLSDLAINAVAALGYSMGAVDIIYNERHNLLAVLEVNAKPGMEGTTVAKYVEAVIKGIN